MYIIGDIGNTEVKICLFSINKTVRAKTTVIEGRTVNQRDTYSVEGYIREKNRKYSSFIKDGYVWYAPFKIEKKDKNTFD